MNQIDNLRAEYNGRFLALADGVTHGATDSYTIERLVELAKEYYKKQAEIERC